jgi:large subunit ribosomal protein L35
MTKAQCVSYQILKTLQKNSKVMPTLKTKSSAKKRFAFTGTGKIKRKHAYHSHILTKKETTQKRNLDHTTLVSRDDEKRVKRMLLSSGM